MLETKIAVVEDEVIIADSICDMLGEMGYTALPPCGSYEEAVSLLRSQRPDLLLLDINLGQDARDGIELAAHIRTQHSLPFIFLTANSDPATVGRAKLVKPNAFLVKPFMKDDLYAAIEIAMHNFYGWDRAQAAAVGKHVFMKEAGRQHPVALHDIHYIESDHVYLRVVTAARTYLVRSTVEQYLKQLDETSFIRIHRSYVINKQHVEKVFDEGVRVAGKLLPISRTYRDQVLSILL